MTFSLQFMNLCILNDELWKVSESIKSFMNIDDEFDYIELYDEFCIKIGLRKGSVTVHRPSW